MWGRYSLTRRIVIVVSHRNLPTLRYLKEPAPVGQMKLDQVSKWCQHCASKPPLRSQRKSLSWFATSMRPGVFFQRQTLTLSLLRELRMFKYQNPSESIQPTSFWWEKQFPKPEILTDFTQLNPELSQLLTLEESNHLDSASQPMPGCSNSTDFGQNKGYQVLDASSSSRLKSWCPQRAAVRMRQRSSLNTW